jgi:ABC-type multidrug transport system fused ATPase/permease subunit
MLDWLHDLPTLPGAILVCAAFVVPTLVGSFVLQPYIARLFRGENDINTVLGFLLNAFALYFGVLLALLSIAVFENHNKAEDAVTGEAAAIVKLNRDIRAYPETTQTELSNILHRYVDEVINRGWAVQARGGVNMDEVTILNEFHRLVGTIQPTSPGQTARYSEMLRALDGFVEARRLRIAAGNNAIPKIMWFVVLVGAAMNIFVIWMFDLRPVTHAIIGGTISLFIGLVIYMVAVLDEPFRGALGIKPDAIIAVHEQSGMRK